MFEPKNHPRWPLSSSLRWTPKRAYKFQEWRDGRRANLIGETATVIHFESWASGLRATKQHPSHAGYAQFAERELQERQMVDLHIDNYCPPNFSFPATVRNLTITGLAGDAKNIVVQGLKLDTLIVNPINAVVEVVDCFVESMEVGTQHFNNLKIRNSWIGVLRFTTEGNLRLEILDSGLYRVMCPGSKNPFAGPVVVRGTWISRNSDHGGDPQQFRNIRQHLAELGIVPAAGVFHAAELALDRANEPFWARTFSWLYEVLSDYGNSIGRPLYWFLGIWGAIFLLILIGDFAEVADGRSLAGWQLELSSSSILRASLFPVQSIFNPLGVLAKPLLVSKSVPWAIVFSLVSFWATAALFFFALALRRRFRLSS